MVPIHYYYIIPNKDVSLLKSLRSQKQRSIDKVAAAFGISHIEKESAQKQYNGNIICGDMTLKKKGKCKRKRKIILNRSLKLRKLFSVVKQQFVVLL